MTTHRHDALVIGAGHNGLVAASYLARAGLDVHVLERRERIGGATVTEEHHPGHRYSVFSYLVSLLRPEVIEELELIRHGLVLLPMESTFNPLPGGDYLLREADPRRTYRNLARHSPRDAEAYSEYKITMHHMAQAMYELQSVAAPELSSPSGESAEQWAELSRHFLGMPDDQVTTLLQMLTMSAADFLDQWFESDALKAALSTSSIIGSFLSPKTPGSAYVLLHHYMGEIDGVYRAWAFAKGGTGAVAAAIASAATSYGATIETGAAVAQVLVEGNQVRGVVLENGDEHRARIVVSSLAPQWTFDRLLPTGSLPEEMTRAVSRWNSTGCSGKLNLSLSELPVFEALPEPGRHLAGGISISPSVDYIERAYDDAKYGQFSEKPFIDMVLPSVIDPDMAPPGGHVMSCFVQYAPYELRDASWDEKREDFGDAIMDVLEEYIPDIRRITVHRQVLCPVDIERIVGIPGGNIFHGELRLSQLFLSRPAPWASAFATPIDGYYVCGSSVHPGGGISGAPGRLAARRILADEAER